MAKSGFLAKFLELFTRLSRDSSAANNLPLKVLDNEPISRFLYQGNQFTLSTGRVSPSAFMPSEKHKNISVYRIVGCSSREVWEIAGKFVDTPNRSSQARADVTANLFREQTLDFDANGQPHFRHANVIGWPAEKAQQKMKAVELSAKAKLFARDN